jgi:hypothetical protein
MCCFSGPVRDVADTKIFARRAGARSQYLVYSMKYAASRPVAMILPLPVAGRSDRVARFINLQRYPNFFVDLERGFPKPAIDGLGGAGGLGGGSRSRGALAVQAVGDFVASYVPGLDDFARLDRRFVLPRQTWDQLPAYQDYGFAVFQLRGAAGRGRKVHPMALEFDSRMPEALFFPTVHIHDGLVHEREHFDHALYFQSAGAAETPGATTSPAPASAFVDIDRARGIVAGTPHAASRD